MYTTFFGLRELPFPLANDPHFFYPTPATQKAEQSIITVLQEYSGLVLLTGESGTGKTTVLQRVVSSLSPRMSILVLPFSTTFDDILTHVCDQFSITPANNDQFTKVLAIQEHLQTAAEGGMHVILCIDEAQNLRKETIDRLRLLLHLKGPNGKLLQLLLVGQPLLEAKLAHPDLRHIQQYITGYYRLEPLTNDAVRLFILHRLRIAGCNRTDLFTPGALKSIAHYSQCVPRTINVICDNVLIAAYLARRQTISQDLVESVARNLRLHDEARVSEPQEAHVSTPSVQRPALPPQSSSHQWFTNLVWTGAGIAIAWFSTNPHPFSFSPLNALFATKIAQVRLPDASPALGPMSPALLPRQSQGQLTLPHSEVSPPAPGGPISLPGSIPTTHIEQKDTALLPQPVQPTVPPVQAQDASQAIITTNAAGPPFQSPPLPSSIVSPTLQEVMVGQQSSDALASDLIAPVKLTSEPSGTGTQQHLQQSARQSQTAGASRVPRTEGARAALIDTGIRPTREAFFRAVAANEVQEVERLLTAHAPVNAKDERGWTALMIAARDNHPDLVRLLLTHGAAVNLTNQEGETALMHAADNDLRAIVQLLLKYGASIDMKSNLGWTALMYAASKGHLFTVETLLANGADAGVKDKDGWTASMYATLQGNTVSRQEQVRGTSAFRTRLGRLDAERLDLVKRRDYSETASLLKEAENKK